MQIISHQLGHRMSRRYRDAGVDFLSTVNDVKMRCFKVGLRALLIHGLGPVQAQHIDRIIGQPFQYIRHADFERIDLPRNEF